MVTIFQRIPAMGNIFGQASLLRQAQIAGPSDVFRRHQEEPRRLYCDPSVDPLCPNPYEGPVPVSLQGDNNAFNAGSSERETPPNLNCNVEWDPGCPRPKPNQTMVPYVPSSYLRGSDRPIQIGAVEFHPPLIFRRKR